MKQTTILIILFAFFGLVALVWPSQAAPTVNIITVTTASDDIWPDGFCSLREALHNANNNTQMFAGVGECAAGSASQTDIIRLVSGETYTLTLPGSGEDEGDLDVLDNGLPLDLRLEPDGATPATIQMTVVGQRVMEIHDAAVEINNLTLTGGSTADFGGGILNNGGNLTLTRVQLLNNSANAGGGLYNDNGAVLISENSEVTLNQGALGGGGIGNTGDLTIRSSIIRANGSNGGSGGGVYSGGGTLLVEANSAINLNQSAVNGGGLLLTNDIVSARIHNSVVQGNTADNDGGGIHYQSLEFSKVTVEGSQIADNSAGGAGGGFWGTGQLTNTRVNNNSSENIGGGLYTPGTLYLNDMQIDGNTAVFGGGMGGRDAIGARLQIYSNHASQLGGGSYVSYFELQDSWIGGNSAGAAGGGIYADNNVFVNATATLQRVLLDSNSAPNGANIWTDRRLALGNVTITRQDVKAKTEGPGMDSAGIMGG